MKYLNLRLRFLIAAFLVPAVLSACQPITTSGSSAAVDYRYERFTDMQIKADYNNCRKTGFALDKEAGVDPSRFIASADKFENCELMISNSQSLIDREMRLKTIAMSVQNYIKGGDLAKARAMLEQFEQVAAGQDLLYPDSTSFVSSMRVLLNASSNKNSFRLASHNAKTKIKSELSRAWHWQAN